MVFDLISEASVPFLGGTKGSKEVVLLGTRSNRVVTEGTDGEQN